MTPKTAVPPTPKVTSLAEIKKKRTVLAEAPSGNIYRVRAMNISRYALAGGLPAPLRNLARQGADGIQQIFSEENDEETFTKQGDEIKSFLDDLVRQVLIEPDLTDFDLDDLPPVDYQWAVSIAMNETDLDGKGRLLWGSEPLSRWETFRVEHSCEDDCEACQRVINSFRAGLEN